MTTQHTHRRSIVVQARRCGIDHCITQRCTLAHSSAKRTRARTWMIGSCLLLCGMVCGCHKTGGLFGVDRCADIPAGAIPAPVGTRLTAWRTMQTSTAALDQGVLYQADFIGNSVQLSPSARKRFNRVLADGNLPIIIEPSSNPQLDQERLAAVGGELLARGITPSDDLIRIAEPTAIGLTPQQSEQIIRSTSQTRGTSANLPTRP